MYDSTLFSQSTLAQPPHPLIPTPVFHRNIIGYLLTENPDFEKY